MDRVPTGCKALDALSEGGLATGTITQLFGEKALGKSLLSFQAAYAAACQGASALIIDTEQSYFSYLLREGRWDSRLAKRFGKEVPVRELKLTWGPRSSRKARQVNRSQLVTALGGALSQAGVAFNDSQLGMAADIFSPEMRFGLEGDSPSVMITMLSDT